jgi:uncharacterized protein (TIGR00369 family)
VTSDSLLDRVLNADVAMLERLGLSLAEASEDHVIIHGDPHPDLQNSFDIVHGSHAFAALDTAAAYALAARGIHAATIGSHVTFSRPVSAGAEVVATARVVTAGRTLATVRAELTVDGRIAALGTFEFKVRSVAD